MSFKRETRTTSVDGDELEYWLSTSLTSTEAVSAWVNPENKDSLYSNIAQYIESELIFFWLSSIRAIANLAQTNPYVLFLCVCLASDFASFFWSTSCFHSQPCPFQVSQEDRNTHIHVRKWYNTIFFYSPEINNRPSADDYLTMCLSHPTTPFCFSLSWVWLTVCHGSWPLYFPFQTTANVLFPPPNSWNCFATSEISGRQMSKEKKKSHARQIRGMRGAWWRHVAFMGPVTWHGCVVEMTSEESFGRKVERSASAEVTIIDSEIHIPDKCFAPIQLRNRVRGLLKSTLLGCYRNLMLRSPSLCETHDNADKAYLMAWTWRSQRTRRYYQKSTGNESLTKTWVWAIALMLLVLLPRCPAWRNNNLVTSLHRHSDGI